MSPEQIFDYIFTFNSNDPLKTVVQLAAVGGFFLTLLTTLITRTLPWIQAKWESRRIARKISSEFFTQAEIERSLMYYVSPHCQSVDPSGGEEPRMLFGAKQQLFSAFDEILTTETEYKHLILLADSGMGKTSALLNYFTRHQRRKNTAYNIELVPLNIPDPDAKISAVQQKSRTVLFLDALDEDMLAIVDHRERLRDIIELSREFQFVVISCRTQFFLRDEEIPVATGILKVKPRKANESAEYELHKLYLSPFSDLQVEQFLRKRFPVWQWKKRTLAQLAVRKMPHLSARPMLLAHIEDLVQGDKTFRYACELYEEMVGVWLNRERGFIGHGEDIRQWSEMLAVELYVNRAARGIERIPKEDLLDLARHWRIDIEDWKLTGRSLLNRDAEGNFKFAHRSVMEYLFVVRFLNGDIRCLQVEWTDQMQLFFYEMYERFHIAVRRGIGFEAPRVERTRCYELLRPFNLSISDISTIPDRFEAWTYADRLCAMLLGRGESQVRIVVYRIFVSPEGRLSREYDSYNVQQRYPHFSSKWGYARKSTGSTRVSVQGSFAGSASNWRTNGFLELEDATPELNTAIQVPVFLGNVAKFLVLVVGNKEAASRLAQQEVVYNIFRRAALFDWLLRDVPTREVMVVRRDLCLLEFRVLDPQTLDNLALNDWECILIWEGSIANVIGATSSEELRTLTSDPDRVPNPDFRSLMRPPVFVPGSSTLFDLCVALQSSSSESAVLLDEFGGIEGAVTRRILEPYWSALEC